MSPIPGLARYMNRDTEDNGNLQGRRILWNNTPVEERRMQGVKEKQQIAKLENLWTALLQTNFAIELRSYSILDIKSNSLKGAH